MYPYFPKICLGYFDFSKYTKSVSRYLQDRLNNYQLSLFLKSMRGTRY